jgi:hypothetical protein
MSIAVTRGTHRHYLTNSARHGGPNAFPRDCSKRPAKGHEKLVPDEACLRAVLLSADNAFLSYLDSAIAFVGC